MAILLEVADYMADTNLLSYRSTGLRIRKQLKSQQTHTQLKGNSRCICVLCVCVRERVPSASREGKLPSPAPQVALRSKDGQVRGVQIWGLQWQRK